MDEATLLRAPDGVIRGVEIRHKNAFEFRQKFPHMNFALYLQYWHGYGETLLRFDQFGDA